MSAILRAPRLSRDGRDTLWLLAVLALCIAPHLERLPLWCSLGTAAAIAWRARLAWRDAPLPPRWVLMVSLIACVGLTLMSYQSLFGRQAGVTLVTILAALKTLELRARRDAFVVTSLGFFLILTQFLFSQAIGMALLMLLALLGLLSALVLAQRTVGRPSLGAAMAAAGRCLVMGVPVMVALYIFFPRFGPLWSVPADSGTRTGLSEQMRMGGVAELAQDDSVALRVRFLDTPPTPSDLYFRGPVLDLFDGQNWTSSLPGLRKHPRKSPNGDVSLQPRQAPHAGSDAATTVSAEGRAVRYQMTLEPNQLRSVPLLDGTLEAAPSPPLTEPVLQRAGLSWVAERPVTERSQIDGLARLMAREAPTHPDALALRQWVQLPRGYNPRTLAWAADMRSSPAFRDADASALAIALMRHIRQAGFRYTLSPGDDAPDDQGQAVLHQVDRFWLDRRSGFCEHFAAAFVVVMRAMDVPARVVTGFQGAELNPVDGLYVVRNSDAHAWAEYWQPELGWVRVDPTAAVAPERIDRPRPPLRNAQGLPATLSKLDPAFWSGVRAYTDAANHRWNIWVLQYSRNQQMSMLSRWGVSSPDWTDLMRVCAGLLVLLSLGGLAWLWWRRPRTPRSAWHRPMVRLHQALLAAGFDAPDNSPAPAAALAWSRQLSTTAIGTLAPEGQAAHAALLQALTTLDALRYGAAPMAHAPGFGARQAMRKAIDQAIAQAIAQAKILGKSRPRGPHKLSPIAPTCPPSSLPP